QMAERPEILRRPDAICHDYRHARRSHLQRDQIKDGAASRRRRTAAGQQTKQAERFGDTATNLHAAILYSGIRVGYRCLFQTSPDTAVRRTAVPSLPLRLERSQSLCYCAEKAKGTSIEVAASATGNCHLRTAFSRQPASDPPW